MDFNIRKTMFVGFTCFMLAGCAANQSQVEQDSDTTQASEQYAKAIHSVADTLISSPHLQMMYKDDDTLLLEFPGIQAFNFDGTGLSQPLQTALKDVAAALMHHSHLNIEVAGHTDNIGNPDYNKTLSENRAHQVADFLGQQGIQMDRIQVAGMGQSAPIADNRTTEGRAANRRVEMTIFE
ncbi:OmpA family protein [Nitrincola sp. MINF-07-Sa-05]|uniref:OmpA family protein n=1 Tax=Nitrincola salilacus TaxID=3400273 RepID=UPI003918613D